MVALALDAIPLGRFGVLLGTSALAPSESILPLDWPELERALPDGGFPRGVTEIAARPRMGSRARGGVFPESMRGGTTTIAIAAMSAVHAANPKAWCAWISAEESSALYAPALAHAGVDLERLLILRPQARSLGRAVVKAAQSGAFDLVVVDVPNRQDLGPNAGTKRQESASLVVRKLALSAEESGTSSLLLTSALAPCSTPWPVALRLEVERRPDSLSVHITKDRRGCGTSQHIVGLASREAKAS
jgi:recombination protein RecA